MQQGYVRTTAGDLERERFSPKANFIEGMGIMTFILVTLWGIAYSFGVMEESNGVKKFSEILLTLGALYMLFVAPFLHGETASAWGLGTPRGLWKILKEAAPLKRAVLALILTGLFVGLNTMNIYHWEEVVKFFNLRETGMTAWKQGFPGILGMVAFGSILSLLIITFGIRYDNFLSAFRTAMIVALPLFALILLGAVAQRGSAAFSDFKMGAFLLGIFGYVFWGFVQQLLFSSYLGTRIRKGFGPSTAASNVIALKNRFGFTASAATIGSFATAILLLILLRDGEGNALPGWSVFAFALFFLPLFAVYAWFFALDRKRLLVATLSGSCFGLIHIDSYGLVGVTFLLGIALTYVFMVDANRNLIALGFIHGLLGSSFGTFFSDGKSGALEVDYGVGPWNVDNPTWGVLIFPVLCILFYGAMTCWYTLLHKETTPA
ncbi:MAG: hypothetical protein KAH38_06520 [Candidatus Hydrogenedentes bacterium]|nr:hypothetical protein [Candidatus Hydrogenedentota bacterium]